MYHTCRALLVHRRDDLAMFDRAFDAFWRDARRRVAARRARRPAERAARRSTDAAATPGGSRASAWPLDAAAAEPSPGVLQTWSDARTLAHKDFAEFTPDEIALARAALDRLEWTPGERRTRRWVRGRGPRVDLRRALAQQRAHGRRRLQAARRRRRTRPRPVVLLCDVSGSMERYSRMLLHFAHAIGRRHRRVEAFVFSTDLTRVTTRASRSHGSTRRWPTVVAVGARTGPAARASATRCGSSISGGARRALHGGPVVLLISDGWDRGDPAVLREQIKRLQRSCHRLIWLNPLIGTLDYAPLTRGLQAALPFVDDFLPARTLSNLADLALHLNACSGADQPHELRGLGYEHPTGTFGTHGYRRHLHVQRAARSGLGAADGSRGDLVLHPRLRHLRADGREPLSRAADRGAGGDHRQLRRHGRRCPTWCRTRRTG